MPPSMRPIAVSLSTFHGLPYASDEREEDISQWLCVINRRFNLGLISTDGPLAKDGTGKSQFAMCGVQGGAGEDSPARDTRSGLLSVRNCDNSRCQSRL
jgi:hypothetical protein